jgi:hypothetical protein
MYKEPFSMRRASETALFVLKAVLGEARLVLGKTISYNRRKDREYVELVTPRLSALLSGTPKQVSALVPSAENGLFSRFIFYYMNILPVWKDVFAGDENTTLDDYFRNLGNQFFDFYKSLQHLSEPLRFCLTKAQQQAFNAYFAETQNQYLCLCGIDYLATVRRLALITFRMAMIFTTLRIMQTKHYKTPFVCSDTDFNTVLEMVKILVQHAAKVFSSLPAETTPTQPSNPTMALFQALPQQFEKSRYNEIAAQLQIPESTANKWLTKFVTNNLLIKQAHGSYSKKDT